jgi:hypothetical protein
MAERRWVFQKGAIIVCLDRGAMVTVIRDFMAKGSKLFGVRTRKCVVIVHVVLSNVEVQGESVLADEQK